MAEAKGFRPKQDRDHPPLDFTFFMRAARHVTDGDLGPILRRAEQLGQPDLCSAVRPVSMEQYLGRLYFEMNNSPTDGNLRAYFDLVRLYAAELLTTTNWMMGRKGSISRLIRRELDAGRRLSIITFNHDLLIENALAGLSTRRYGTAWCLQHAYHLRAISSVIGIPDGDRWTTQCPGERGEHVPIYKMLQLPSWSNKLTGKSRRDWYLWPLVVPPVYEKHGFIHGRLRDVWDTASGALRRADRVVFWGYSFPNADLHARYFVQGAAQTNGALRTPILINPDPAAHAALWSVLRPRHVQHFHDIRDFLASAA